MKNTSIVMTLIIFILCGCSSVEKTIVQSLNEEIEKQNACNSENTKLTELMKEESIIDNRIIEKGTESYPDISELVNNGVENISSSEKLLSTYEVCVKDSIKNKDKLEKATLEIKDSAIKSDTLNLLESYHDYQNSLIEYIEALKILNESQANFYQSIHADTPFKEIESLVYKINEAIDETNTISLTHKEKLNEFNSLFETYFEQHK